MRIISVGLRHILLSFKLKWRIMRFSSMMKVARWAVPRGLKIWYAADMDLSSSATNGKEISEMPSLCGGSSFQVKCEWMVSVDIAKIFAPRRLKALSSLFWWTSEGKILRIKK